MIGVVVTPEVAARLAPGLRTLRRALEYGNGVKLDAATETTLRDIELLARASRAQAMSERCGTVGIPDDGAVVMLRTIDVAARCGITPRAVTAAAKRGSLPARRAGREWRFDEIDVERWRSRDA